VDFMYAVGVFDEFEELIVYFAIAVGCWLIVMVAMTAQGRLSALRENITQSFNAATSTTEFLQLTCAKVTGGMTVFLFPLLTGLYWAGANVFECGRVFPKLSASRLLNAGGISWGVALLNVLYYCFAGAGLAWMNDTVTNGWHTSSPKEPDEAEEILDDPPDEEQHNSAGEGPLLEADHGEGDDRFGKAKKQKLQGFGSEVPEPAPERSILMTAGMSLAWVVVICILSIPQLLFVIDQSLPGGDNNTWGIPVWVMKGIHWFIGPISHGMVSFIGPRAAHTLTKKFNKGVVDIPSSCIMLEALHLMAITVLPLVAVLLISADCKAGWLQLWTPCSHDSRFDISLPVTPSIFKTISVKYQVVKHESVCNPAGKGLALDAGRCQRTVLHQVSHLVIKKLIWAASLSPLFLIFRNLGPVKNTQERIIRIFKKEFSGVKHMDAQTAFWLAGPLENCLILGFLAPAIFPLVTMAFLGHVAAFRFNRDTLGVRTSNEVQPRMSFLYLALLLGLVWSILTFFASELEGKWLVCIAAPIGAAASWKAANMYLAKSGHLYRNVADGDSRPQMDLDSVALEDEHLTTAYVSME